eukprot:9471521-Pyramimonas_sp.AAC.1
MESEKYAVEWGGAASNKSVRLHRPRKVKCGPVNKSRGFRRVRIWVHAWSEFIGCLRAGMPTEAYRLFK